MADLSLLRLLQITDPTLPIGGFSHSAGLETYVQQGAVHNQATALAFIEGQLRNNLAFNDAAFVSLAYDAALEDRLAAIVDLDQNCTALKLPREIREASQKLGLRLIKIFQPLVANSCGAAYLHQIRQKESSGHYCIAFGIYAAAMGIGKKEALTGFFYNAAAGMVANSVKLVPLGQQDGQAILFSLHPLMEELATATLDPDPQLLGRCCTGFDIRSMQHESLYSRLYMS